MDMPAPRSLPPASNLLAWRPWASAESRLLTRYVLVSGAFGLPASIIQLRLMLWGYEWAFGEYDRLILNALWIVNFELSLMRNFLLHCLISWRVKPTRRKAGHAHVAATGAFVIDIIAFNVVHILTDVLIIAQIFGASSGFFCNFLYNRFRTFGAPRKRDESMAEGGVP
jgi:putative flippase GtrA